MGVARLLAKGWVVFCLFAGVHGFNLEISRDAIPANAFVNIAICTALFAAMGLLFIAGFGASAGGSVPMPGRLKPRQLIPSFDDAAFVVFAAASLIVQIYFSHPAVGGAAAEALQNAMYVVVPGQRALAQRLIACNLGHDGIFAPAAASACAWLLAVVFIASATSRIGLSAGLIRLERALRPSPFGLTLLAAIYGTVAIVTFQLLYMGSLYPFLGCGVFTGITGSVLIGLAPLMLAYLVVAALTTLKASAPEG